MSELDSETRFLANVDKHGPEARPGLGSCWEWTGSRNKKGYGVFRAIGRVELAHRASWALANGLIPSGLCVLHKCDRPSCVNPAHLFIGTQADNVADMEAKGRGSHPRGDRHGSRTHPERLARGEAHSVKMREVAARGEAHGRRTHPERTARGERVAGAKLTEDDVSIVRALRAEGWKQSELAIQFGVSKSLVSLICLRKNWAHVKQDLGNDRIEQGGDKKERQR